MANSTKVAAVLLVFLQASCVVVSQLQNVPAVMTLNGFQEGEGGGGPAACDGQYHSDDDYLVSLSSRWFQGGARCNKLIRLGDSANNLYTFAWVVDECRDCDHEVGASAAVWRSFHLDPSLGEVSISWSDIS